MATFDDAMKDLSEGCTAWRSVWPEGTFLEGDHGEDTDGKREWVTGEEPFALTIEKDGKIEPYEPDDEDKGATDWQED